MGKRVGGGGEVAVFWTEEFGWRGRAGLVRQINTRMFALYFTAELYLPRP